MTFPGFVVSKTRFITVFVLVIACVICGAYELYAAEKVLFRADTFSSASAAESAGWKQWSQRDEISPDFTVVETPNLGGNGSLCISGASNSAAHGCWYYPVDGVTGGKFYRVDASYLAKGVQSERWKVVARLDWMKADGSRTGRPEYLLPAGNTGDWKMVSGVFQAPEAAASVEIELYLGFSAQGTVCWDDISLTEVAAPPKRIVRAATVNCYPRGCETSAEAVAEVCDVASMAGEQGADIVCLGEGVNLAGVNGAVYSTIAEPIPGPTTDSLGEVAKKHNMYIVAALGEKDGSAIYNTAVLIGRDGKVEGTYRKVQLPREEIEAGVTPGSDYPVFDTDFGRIGMMICWDVQYAEPARARFRRR